MWGYILCFMAGGAFGIGYMALVITGKQADEHMEKLQTNRGEND